LNKPKKISILMFIILGIFIMINSGCTTPVIPPDPDPDDDNNNYVVSYVHIKPSSVTMQLGSSKQFELTAYDSEDKLIPVTGSEVEWEVGFECWACGKVWKLSPESGSKTTTFTPEKVGKYHIYGYYKDEVDDSIISVE
jgi:hypothetical protein